MPTQTVTPDLIRSRVAEAPNRHEKLVALRQIINETLPLPKNEARVACLRESHRQIEIVRSSIVPDRGSEADTQEAARLQEQVSAELGAQHPEAPAAAAEPRNKLERLWSGANGHGGLKKFLRTASLAIAGTLGNTWLWNRLQSGQPVQPLPDAQRPGVIPPNVPANPPAGNNPPVQLPIAPAPRPVNPRPAGSGPEARPEAVPNALRPADVWEEVAEKPDSWRFPICAYSKHSLTIDASLADQRWFYNPIDGKSYNRSELLARLKQLSDEHKLKFPNANADARVMAGLVEPNADLSWQTLELQRIAHDAGAQWFENTDRHTFTSRNVRPTLPERGDGLFNVNDKEWNLGDVLTRSAGEREPEHKFYEVRCMMHVRDEQCVPPTAGDAVIVVTIAGQQKMLTPVEFDKLMQEITDGAKPVKVRFDLRIIRQDTTNKSALLQPFFARWKEAGHLLVLTQIQSERSPQIAANPMRFDTQIPRPADVWITHRTLPDGRSKETWSMPIGILRYEDVQSDARQKEQKWFYNLVDHRRYTRTELAARLREIKATMGTITDPLLEKLTLNLRDQGTDSFAFRDETQMAIVSAAKDADVAFESGTPQALWDDYQFAPPYQAPVTGARVETRKCLKTYTRGNFLATAIDMRLDYEKTKATIPNPETTYIAPTLDVALHDDKSVPPAQNNQYWFVQWSDEKRGLTNEAFLAELQKMKTDAAPIPVRFTIRVTRNDASNVGAQVQQVIDQLQQEGHSVLIHNLP